MAKSQTKDVSEKAEPELLSIQYDVSFTEQKEHFAGTKRPVDIRNKRYTKNFYVTEEGAKNAELQTAIAAKDEAGRIGGKDGYAKKDLMDSWLEKKLVKLHSPLDENGFRQPAVVAEALAGDYNRETWSPVEEYMILDGVPQDIKQPDGSVAYAETDYYASTRDVKMTQSRDETGWYKKISKFYSSGAPLYEEFFGDKGHENRGPHNLCTIYYTEGGLITTGTMRKNDMGDLYRLNAKQIEEVGGVAKESEVAANGFISQLKVA